MGMVVDGVWHDSGYDTSKTNGAFVRPPTVFRQRVTAEGTAQFPAVANRYHLYVSLACPWAHRVLIYRALKGLEEVLPISVVQPLMSAQGWTFATVPGAIPEGVNGATHLYEIYQKADPHYTGRVTVPVLWDTLQHTIVNNESPELIRMLNTEFDALATRPTPDYYPPHLRDEIDRWNERIYHPVNNGVYRAGFATAQTEYERAVTELFETLEVIEHTLASRPYLCGTEITEADWRLFPTLIRFDAVYHGHFKCNLRRIVDYPNLWRYTRALYHHPQVGPTVNFEHIKGHYYASHLSINPTGIVPKGPTLDLSV